MPVIALLGPNTVGKTTAARRWASRYRGLTACLCDVRRVINGGVEEVETHSWKTSRHLLVERYRDWPGVVLVEGASGYGLRVANDLRADVWLVLTCSPEASRAMRRARCQRLGKPFNPEVWDERALRYEGQLRFDNFLKANPPAGVVHRFTIEDQAADWPTVDAAFAREYCRLHNRWVRERGNP